MPKFYSFHGRSSMIVPKEYEEFAKTFKTNNDKGIFLGENPPESDILNRAQFIQTRKMAKFIYNSANENSTPEIIKEKVIARTKKATEDFFSLVYKFLLPRQEKFPLAGLNKCLGLVVVPNSNLVMIAISQNKDPSKDILVRKDMVCLLNEINKISEKWKFELACIPTKTQYLMPRTFFMRTPHQAPQEWVDPPHTLC